MNQTVPKFCSPLLEFDNMEKKNTQNREHMDDTLKN